MRNKVPTNSVTQEERPLVRSVVEADNRAILGLLVEQTAYCLGVTCKKIYESQKFCLLFSYSVKWENYTLKVKVMNQ